MGDWNDWTAVSRLRKPRSVIRELTNTVVYDKCNPADKRDHTWCTAEQCIAILLVYQQCAFGAECNVPGCLSRHQKE